MQTRIYVYIWGRDKTESLCCLFAFAGEFACTHGGVSLSEVVVKWISGRRGKRTIGAEGEEESAKEEKGQDHAEEEDQHAQKRARRFSLTRHRRLNWRACMAGGKTDGRHVRVNFDWRRCRRCFGSSCLLRGFFRFDVGFLDKVREVSLV